MTPTSNPDLTAITTQDSSKNVYLLVANRGQKSYTVDAEFSELITTGTGTMWKFSSQVMDEVVGNPVLDNGHVTFNVSAQAAKLIKLQEDS